ncbi:MAG: DUF4399 domain-containing protein [Gammaproteobacteria bacterium]|nr:DUF4399 domain-containing protein [Gammaproteobacteria bacterium]
MLKRFMPKRLRALAFIPASMILLLGCGQDAEVNETPAAAPATPAPAPGLERQPAPEGAAAYIIEPADGAVVSNPVRVLFGLRGFGVVPAGIERADAGHHHLLIDTDLPNLDLPIPADDNHVHFGGGQTETELTLEPGTHTLQLLLGDELHVPHDPPIASQRITIEVR